MKHSVTELVGVILRRMHDEPDAPSSESSLRSWLAGQGYSKRDIDAAIKMVGPRFSAQLTAPRPHQLGSIRSYSLQEEYKLSSEARDALTRLERYGLLGPFEREQILDNLGHFDGEVGLEELDCLLSWLICGNRDVEFQQMVAKVIENQGGCAH